MVELTNFLNWRNILEILILWFFFYRLFLFFYGSRALYIMRGVILIFILFFIFQKLGLSVLVWLFGKFFGFFILFLVIIFQPELREALLTLGTKYTFFVFPRQTTEKTLSEIVKAVNFFSEKKWGALIALKRKVGLNNYLESGVTLNAHFSIDLLKSIFFPGSPLHDGGVIIEGDKILGAACLFPYTERYQFLNKTFGMRHRAALGLSENSDAIIIVISEETGEISIAISGQIVKVSQEELFTILKGQFKEEK